MKDEDREDDLDELLDSLPWHLRTKVLKSAYGVPEDEVDPEPTVRRKPLTAGESALWWLLLPVAAAASLALVVLAVVASALLLLPVAAMLGAAAAVPIGMMVTWRLRTEAVRNATVTQLERE